MMSEIGIIIGGIVAILLMLYFIDRFWKNFN